MPHIYGQAGPDESPMPVIVHTIQLPPISSVPIILHPFLRYSITPSILFDLNGCPTAISLHPHLSANGFNQTQIWLNEPAAFPSNICSLTIRIVGIEWPTVIIAATNSITGIITVRDVLCACYRAWREAKAQSMTTGIHSYSSQQYTILDPTSRSYLLASYEESGSGGRETMTAVNQLNAGAASKNQCYFRHSSHWNGLYASEVEPDVWILRPSPPIKRT